MAGESPFNPYAAPKTTLQKDVSKDQWSVHYVGFWLRFVAFFIDIIVLLILYGAIFGSIYGWDTFSIDGGARYEVHAPWWLWPVYCLTFWLWKSSTPGKLIFSARIVDVDTLERPKVWQYVVRFLGYFVSIYVLGLGCLWIAFNEKKRGWHDLMAKTVVVRD